MGSGMRRNIARSTGLLNLKQLRAISRLRPGACQSMGEYVSAAGRRLFARWFRWACKSDGADGGKTRLESFPWHRQGHQLEARESSSTPLAFQFWAHHWDTVQANHVLGALHLAPADHGVALEARRLHCRPHPVQQNRSGAVK